MYVAPDFVKRSLSVFTRTSVAGSGGAGPRQLTAGGSRASARSPAMRAAAPLFRVLINGQEVYRHGGLVLGAAAQSAELRTPGKIDPPTPSS